MFTKKRLLSAFLAVFVIIFIAFIALNKMDKSNPKTTASSSSNNVNLNNKTVLAFTTYYYAGDKSSYDQMINNSSSINDIATNTYTTNGTGTLSGVVPKDQIQYANHSGIKPLAMITNNFNSNIAKEALENPNNRQALIKNILNVLKTNNYKGVNIDFEGVYHYDRSYFITFMSELYDALHPEGYTVTTSVPAKANDNPTNSWSGAYDYAQIAKYSDQVIIMTYDEHSPDGPAGPVAAINWVKGIVNYAVSVMPASKIILGVASYGYDWSSSGVKAYGIDAIYKLSETYGAQIKWDSTSETPYLNYKDKAGINHDLWFENSTSLSYKLDIVNSNNLAGIAIWRLGLENADYWSTIKAKLNK